MIGPACYRWTVCRTLNVMLGSIQQTWNCIGAPPDVSGRIRIAGIPRNALRGCDTEIIGKRSPHHGSASQDESSFNESSRVLLHHPCRRLRRQAIRKTVASDGAMSAIVRHHVGMCHGPGVYMISAAPHQ
jgi:hypothetical protein